MLVSHRANMKVDPENTIAGIRGALEQCVDAVEIDVQATADGVPMLMHDCSLHRAVGDPRLLGELTAEEASALRVKPPVDEVESEPVALLADALRVAAGRALLVLDIKMQGIAPAVAATIREHGRGTRIHLQCEFEEISQYRALLPDVPLTVGLRAKAIKEHGLTTLLDRAAAAGAFGVSIRNGILDACAVDEAHRRGLFVKTWTIDREADMERVVRTGVDAVCGNYPRQMRDVRERLAR